MGESTTLYKHPDVALALIRHLAERVGQLTAQVASLALRDVYSRVRETLMANAGE